MSKRLLSIKDSSLLFISIKSLVSFVVAYIFLSITFLTFDEFQKGVQIPEGTDVNKWSPIDISSLDLYSDVDIYRVPMIHLFISIAIVSAIMLTFQRYITIKTMQRSFQGIGKNLLGVVTFSFLMIVVFFLLTTNIIYPQDPNDTTNKPQLFNLIGLFNILITSGFLLLNSLMNMAYASQISSRDALMSVRKSIPATIMVQIIYVWIYYPFLYANQIISINQITYFPRSGYGLTGLGTVLTSVYGKALFTLLVELLIIIVVLQFLLGIIALRIDTNRNSQVSTNVTTTKPYLGIIIFLMILVAVYYAQMYYDFAGNLFNRYIERLQSYYNPDFINPFKTNLKTSISSDHKLGTDYLGRDILALLLFGISYSILLVAFLAIVVVVFSHLLVKLNLSWFGELFDNMPIVIFKLLPWVSMMYLIDWVTYRYMEISGGGLSIITQRASLPLFPVLINIFLLCMVQASRVMKTDDTGWKQSLTVFFHAVTVMFVDVTLLELFRFGHHLSTLDYVAYEFRYFHDFNPSIIIIYGIILAFLVVTSLIKIQGPGNTEDQLRSYPQV